jgi:flagellar basal body-associated protein FliL
MAKPQKPKELKPGEAGGEEKEAGTAKPSVGIDLPFIILLAAIVLCTTLTSAASVYFLAPMVVVPAIVEHMPKAHGEGDGGQEGTEGEGDKSVHDALSLELDEFTVNLKVDPAVNNNQFLRSKMALNISVPTAENCHEDIKPAAAPHAMLPSYGEQILGAAAPVDVSTHEKFIANGGEAAAPAGPEACLKSFQTKMSRYIPSVRDIINAALMRRTAAQLSTFEGQEELKDEIKEQVNLLLPKAYQVVRVNFEDFIIQR